jgi:hypothetical protein
MFLGETIEPDSTEDDSVYLDRADVSFDRPQRPMVSVNLIVVTDAAGHMWEIRPSKGRPPKLVHRWWRKRVL